MIKLGFIFSCRDYSTVMLKSNQGLPDTVVRYCLLLLGLNLIVTLLYDIDYVKETLLKLDIT